MNHVTKSVDGWVKYGGETTNPFGSILKYYTFAYEGFITYTFDFLENNFARENPTSVIASVPNTTVKSS
jgi:hypothetical protein